MKSIIDPGSFPSDSFYPKKYNWTIVKSDYVEGFTDENGNQFWPTMKQLSLKFGIPYQTVREVARLQQWTTEKNNFITSYEHAKKQEKIKFLAKKSAKFDDNCIKIAEEGVKKIEQFLCGPHIDSDGNKILLSVDDLELAAKTLEKFQKIGRLALGSSTDNVSKSIKTGGETISLSEGLDIVARQLEGNTELMKKLEAEFIDE